MTPFARAARLSAFEHAGDLLTDLIEREAAMTKLGDEIAKRCAQGVCSRARVRVRRPIGDPRAAAAVADEPAFGLEIRIRARDGVRGRAEIRRELPHGRDRRSGCEIAALDERADLLEDLLIRRTIETFVDSDGERGSSHESEAMTVRSRLKS